MSITSRAGACCLLAAAALGLGSVLAYPTLSEEAADQAAALAVHRGAMELGLALGSLAVVLLIGGVVWFARTVYPSAPRLALTGGVLGVFGLLPVMFGDGVSAAGMAVVQGLDTAQATAALDRIGGGAIEAIDPVSLLGDIGLVLLGLAALRIGAPRWGVAAVVLGAIGEGAGFGAAERPVAIVGFALLLVGFAAIVRTTWVRVRTSPATVAAPQPA